jgi:IS5 family transposase
MRSRERRETREQDLCRSRLDQIIDMKHPLVALGRIVDWEFLEGCFGEIYTDDPGHPPLPTRSDSVPMKCHRRPAMTSRSMR